MRPWLITLCLAACSITPSVLVGTDFGYTAAKRTSIRSGTTTKQDVTALFGAPYTIEPGAAGDTWIYYVRESLPFRDGYTDRTLTIQFDTDSVVDKVKYKFKETNGNAKSPGAAPKPPDPALCQQQQQLKLMSPSAPEPTACAGGWPPAQ
jgi:outer membrane protein assembly factor BamE (lipoprotein component of BamABCDE complex)